METLELKQPANSIELARNAKGEYSFHIKCRGDNPIEVQERIGIWDDMLTRRYPVKVKDANASDS